MQIPDFPPDGLSIEAENRIDKATIQSMKQEADRVKPLLDHLSRYYNYLLESQHRLDAQILLRTYPMDYGKEDDERPTTDS